MHKVSAWVVAGFTTVLFPALAFGAFTKTGEASATFLAVGPAGLKIEGKTSDVEVSEADGKLKVAVPLGNLDTGIALRNKHMREKYLEVPKFPKAELVVDRASLKLPADGSETSGDVKGQFTMHGQTKPASVHYSARLAGGTYTVTGTAKINMKDFGVEVPSYLGVTVKPEVDVSVRFQSADR
jgi:polyisoprenoid-binding protein YceI